MCPFITMITKYVKQHGVAVSKIYVETTRFANPFIFCCRCFCKDTIVSQYQCGGLVDFVGQQT